MHACLAVVIKIDVCMLLIVTMDDHRQRTYVRRVCVHLSYMVYIWLGDALHGWMLSYETEYVKATTRHHQINTTTTTTTTHEKRVWWYGGVCRWMTIDVASYQIICRLL
jgi:hypothetical protein